MSALRLLVDVLAEIGEDNAVSIIPIHAELTTQDAAGVLNVSRPFLVQLLERGEMPFHKIGTHRRVRYQDVISYKERIDLPSNETPAGNSTSSPLQRASIGAHSTLPWPMVFVAFSMFAPFTAQCLQYRCGWPVPPLSGSAPR